MSYTYSALIEKTLRYLTPTQVELSLQITTNYVAGSGTLVLDASSPALPAVRPGTVLSNGLQLWLVQSISSNTATVIGGFQGSTDVSVTANSGAASLVYVRPKFSRFDIAVAINDVLDELSSPDNGLGQILSTDPVWVPVFMGYDLGPNFDSATSYILEMQAREPLPLKRYPLIRRNEYRVVRNQTTAGSGGDFPNGAGVIVYSKKAWPGQPMHVQFLAPFSHLVNLTDDALTVAGVPVTAQDIIPLGAAIRLAPTREIQRNTMSTQPDPRKATEVPPNAIQTSTNTLLALYQRRIKQEKTRLVRAFKNAER